MDGGIEGATNLSALLGMQYVRCARRLQSRSYLTKIGNGVGFDCGAKNRGRVSTATGCTRLVDDRFAILRQYFLIQQQCR